MIAEPAGVPAGMPSGEGIPAGAPAQDPAPRLYEKAEVAAQIERAYPGYHVWISDTGWWYATRTHPRARGQSATVHGAGPAELSGALAAEEAAVIGSAMAATW